MSDDGFLSGTLDVSAPGTKAKAIVPGDTAIEPTPRAIYVGTGGDLVMQGVGDKADVTWKSVPAGSLLPFRPMYIRAASTAANLIGVY